MMIITVQLLKLLTIEISKVRGYSFFLRYHVSPFGLVVIWNLGL